MSRSTSTPPPSGRGAVRAGACAGVSTRPPDGKLVGRTPDDAPSELFAVVVYRGGRWPTETVGWFTSYTAGRDWAVAERLDHDEFTVVPFRVAATTWLPPAATRPARAEVSAPPEPGRP